MRLKQSLFLFVGLSVLVVGFQNCGAIKSSSLVSESSVSEPSSEESSSDPLNDPRINGAAVLGPAPVAPQASHYVAPKGATTVCQGAQGGATCPWASVGSALASGKILGGETLLLMDGLHDRIEIVGRSFSPPIIIQSQSAKQAAVDTIFLRTASGFTFRQLTVYGTPAYPFGLIITDQDTSNIIFDDLKVQSLANVDDVLSWTMEQWLARRRPAFIIYGSNTYVINCTIRAVGSGIFSTGTGNWIGRNRISDLSADGLRAGTDTRVFGNHVSNFFRLDEDHIDGFQSISSVTNPVSRLVIARNTILEWTHPEGHPLRASIDGIGMYDGFFDDFTIGNNVVSISGYHGIAVFGGRRGRIVNNTVLHASGAAVS